MSNAESSERRYQEGAMEYSERLCPECDEDDKTVDVWIGGQESVIADYVGCLRCEILVTF